MTSELFAQYVGEPPFDAQYVGTYQPLFGWIGRTGKRWAEAELASLFNEVVAQVAPAGGGFAPFGRRTVGRKNWGVQLMRSVQPAGGEAPGTGNGDGAMGPGAGSAGRGADPGGRRGTAGPGGTGRVLLFSEVPGLIASGGFSGVGTHDPQAATATTLILDPRSASQGARPRPSDERPMDGSSAHAGSPTRLQVGTAAALDLVADSPGFTAVLEAALQENERTHSDLIDWMDEFDFARADARLVLSPIGLLNLYREYYFDFGTRLGPPVEHLWIAPGSDVEITESYSRTDYSFVEFERSLDETVSSEETDTEAETFSEEVERAKQRDIAVGVSAQGGVTTEFYNVSASASFDYANSLTESKRQALERTREVSRKVAKEMRRTSRSLSRTSTEIQQSSTRRHRIANPTGEVWNLEMRRKLQHIGIQVQHLGTALCWQTFVEHPGDFLQLPELVHIGASEDFMSTPPPDDAPVSLPADTTELLCPIEFTPVWIPGKDQGIDENHDYHLNVATYDGRVVATHDPEEDPADSDDVILAEFKFQELRTDGYTLQRATAGTFRGTDPSHDQPSRWAVHCEHTDDEKAKGEFRVILDSVNFEQQPVVEVVVTLLWKPPDPSPGPGAAAAVTEHNRAMQRKARESLVAGVRERVKLTSRISPRHPDDLRAEERAVIYRRLMRSLLGGAVGDELHLVSEKIRTMFDVDRMLYYVAPDWWRPAETSAVLTLPTVETAEKTVVLSDRDRTRYRNDGDTRPGYLITEDSAPAPLGRSLGWVAQLDGDDRRNVFLNSPWVKAVLPIRPGFEAAALTFLSQPHVEGTDGLEAGYVDESGPSGKTVREHLLDLAREIRRHNDPDEVYAAGQSVYENGFIPVDGRVKLTDDPLKVFAEWVEVVPTRQVVPVPYVPPERFRPPPAPPDEGPPAATPPASPPSG